MHAPTNHEKINTTPRTRFQPLHFGCVIELPLPFAPETFRDANPCAVDGRGMLDNRFPSPWKFAKLAVWRRELYAAGTFGTGGGGDDIAERNCPIEVRLESCVVVGGGSPGPR